MGATENTEKKKFEIRSTIRQNDGGQESETNPKFKCSNGQNEKESRIARINRDFGHEGAKAQRVQVLVRHGLTPIDTVCDLTQRESRITQILTVIRLAGEVVEDVWN